MGPWVLWRFREATELSFCFHSMYTMTSHECVKLHKSGLPVICRLMREPGGTPLQGPTGFPIKGSEGRGVLSRGLEVLRGVRGLRV